jgi:GT2 family glycosyltransferase
MAESPYTWTVTVTCNTPGNGLSGRLRARFQHIRTIDNEVSRGFAANHNTVLASSIARFVWLLNDDLVMLPDSVDRITAYMDAPENGRVAVVSPRLLNPDGSLQPSTYSFPTMPQTLLAFSGLRENALTDRALRIAAPVLRPRKGSSRFWAHDRTLVVDTFRGACVAVRMKAVKEVGPMVEVALVGGEEVEWHRRLHARGWKAVFFADASVIHHGSQTVNDGSRNLYPEYLRSLLYYFRLNRPAASFGVFCRLLLGIYAARSALARLRGDTNAFNVARRYAEVIREAMKLPRSSS